MKNESELEVSLSKEFKLFAFVHWDLLKRLFV